jgi:hypothetical protein
MNVTKTLLAFVMAGASSAASAAPVAWTGEFAMYNLLGTVMDTNDGAAGTSAYVTGVIDVTAGTFTVSSTDTWYSLNWTATGGTLFGPGTYTHSTVDPAPAASGGTYTFTVGAGQLGGVFDFAYGSGSGIDTVMVWDVATSGGVTTYTSTDWNGDGIPGAGWIDGFYPGLSANFNMAAQVPEASTYGMMLAGLGLVGAAARRRKQTSA